MRIRHRLLIIGICFGLFLFTATNIVSVHYHSSFGLLAGLGLVTSYDDMKGFGFPFLVWKAGGISYYSYFNWISLLLNIIISELVGVFLIVLSWTMYKKLKYTLLKYKLNN